MKVLRENIMSVSPFAEAKGFPHNHEVTCPECLALVRLKAKDRKKKHISVRVNANTGKKSVAFFCPCCHWLVVSEERTSTALTYAECKPAYFTDVNTPISPGILSNKATVESAFSRDPQPSPSITP